MSVSVTMVTAPLLLLLLLQCFLTEGQSMSCGKMRLVSWNGLYISKSNSEQLVSRTADVTGCLISVFIRQPAEASEAVKLDVSTGTCSRLGHPMFANYSQQPPAVKFYASSFAGSPRLVLLTVKAASGVIVKSLYSTPVADCGSEGFLLLWPGGVPQLASYRSCWIDRLAQLNQLAGLMPRRQLIVELLAASGTRLLSIVFNASFANGWFSKEALLGSFPDLNLKSLTFNMFSTSWLAGNFDRSFYISLTHGGCPHDKGLLAIVENNVDACDWARVNPNPGLLYNLELGEWITNTRAADYFVLSIA